MKKKVGLLLLVWIINGKSEFFLIGVSYYGVEI
jgi:hypothetical protein